MQLDLLLIDLGIEGVKLGLGLVESGASLIEILAADDSGGGEAADAIEILLRPFDLSKLSVAGVLLAFDGCLLLGGIDLHKGCAAGDAVSGVNEDVRDDAFDLRHDDGGVARLERGDVFGGFVDLLQGGRFDLHRHRLWSRRFGRLVIAARRQKKWYDYNRNQQNWR